MDKQHAQQQWQQAVIDYAKAINHYVAQGRTQGWDNLEEPVAPATEHLLPAWQAALQAINQPHIDEQQRRAFRSDWPPAHLPLVPLLEQHGKASPACSCSMTAACWHGLACLTKKARWFASMGAR